MKLTLKTIIDIINVVAKRSFASLKKGPVPFLEGVIVRAKPAAISLFLITSVPIILHEFRKKVNAMLNKTEVRVGAAK